MLRPLWRFLQRGGVNWSTAIGNGDFFWQIPPTAGNFTNFDTYFPPIDANVYPVGSQRNNYRLFTIGGMDFIILNINDNPNYQGVSVPDWDLNWPDQAAVISWANGVLDTYHNRRAIIVSHRNYDAGVQVSQASTLWNQVMKSHGNIFLWLSGHQPPETHTLWGSNGNEVTVIQTDYQEFPAPGAGGNGWLRLLKFYPEQKKVEVRGYSPWLSSSDTTALDAFYGVTTNFDFNYGQQNSPSWWNVLWPYRKFVTYKASTLSENLTNYQVSVILDATNFGAGFTQALASGYDIRFVDEGDVNALSLELVSYNATAQKAEFHVLDPDVVVGQDYVHGFYIYWGNPAAGNISDPTTVWANGYVSVWHMNGDTGTTQDSLYTNNLTRWNTVTEVATVMGTGQYTTNTSSLQALTSANLELTTSNVTTEVFMKPDAGISGAKSVVIKNKSAGSPNYIYGIRQNTAAFGYQSAIGVNGGTFVMGANQTAPAAPVNSWTYVAGVYDHSNISLNINGTLQAPAQPYTANILGTLAVSNNLSIGGTFQNGENFPAQYDEVRISNVARSQGWIATNQLNFNNTLLFYGGTNPYATVTTQAATGVAMTAAGVTSGTLNGNITDLGGTPTTWRWFEGGTNNVTFATFATANVSANATGAFTASLPANLTPGQTYYVRAVTYNGIDGDYSSGVAVVFTMPTVTTSAATPIVAGGVLNGSVSSAGVASSEYVYFEYGTTAAYGSVTPLQTKVGIGAFNATVNSLLLNTTYHYRSVTMVGMTLSYGADQSFTTLVSGGGNAPLNTQTYNIVNILFPILAVLTILIICFKLIAYGNTMTALLLAMTAVIVGLSGFLPAITQMIQKSFGG